MALVSELNKPIIIIFSGIKEQKSTGRSLEKMRYELLDKESASKLGLSYDTNYPMFIKTISHQ